MWEEKMSFQLSDKTKELLSKRIGISYERLKQMKDEEIEAYIEQKTGKKIIWPKGAKIETLPTNQIVTSIRTEGSFSTSCLTDEENIRKMNEQIGKKIAKNEQEISKGRNIVNKENWIIKDNRER